MPRTPVKPGRLRRPGATLPGRRCRNGHLNRSYVTKGGHIVCRTCVALRNRKLGAARRRERLEARRVRLRNRVRPNRRERIWAAGLFEGEGTITIRSGVENRTYPEVSMASTDQEIIDAFQEIWPGKIDRHMPWSKNGLAREAICWRRNAVDDVEAFLLDLRPYFKTTRVRTKAALLLEDIRDRVRMHITPARKPRLLARMKRMREMNRRGRRV